MRRAKIVCTMGPAVESPEKVAELIEAGMNMIANGEKKESVLNKFSGRWGFMKDTLQSLLEENK